MKTFDAIKADFAAGGATCESTTEEYLRAIQQSASLNAFLSVFNKKALEQARRIDRKRAEGKAGSLAGMVVAIKDVLAIEGERVTCGSKILETFVSPYTATSVQRLIDAAG